MQPLPWARMRGRRLATLLAPWTTPLDPVVLLQTFLPEREATPALAHPPRPASAEGSHTATIRWGYRATVVGSIDETILDTLEANELEPTVGCRRGVCRRCVVPLVEGCVRDQRDERDIAAGTHVRICVSTPRADVSLDPVTSSNRSGPDHGRGASDADGLVPPIPAGAA